MKANIIPIIGFYKPSDMPIDVFCSSDDSIAKYQDAIYRYEYVLVLLQSPDCQHVWLFIEQRDISAYIQNEKGGDPMFES